MVLSHIPLLLELLIVEMFAHSVKVKEMLTYFFVAIPHALTHCLPHCLPGGVANPVPSNYSLSFPTLVTDLGFSTFIMSLIGSWVSVRS